jgi:alanyl-tRNA synthetase
LAAVPKNAIDKGLKALKANERIQQLSSVIKSKGGGKPESAQTSETNYELVDEVLELAKKFAATKLN